MNKKVESDPKSDDERNPSWHQSFECSLFGTMKPEEREEREEEEDNSPEPETEVWRGGAEEEEDSHEERCHKMALIVPLRLMMLKRERQRERRKNRSQIKDENGNTGDRRGRCRDQNREMDGVEVWDDGDMEIGISLSPGTDFSGRDHRKFRRYLQRLSKNSPVLDGTSSISLISIFPFENVEMKDRLKTNTNEGYHQHRAIFFSLF